MEESRRRFVAALTAGATGMFAGCASSDSATPTESKTESQAGTQTGPSVTTETESQTRTESPARTETEDSSEGPPLPPAETVAVAGDGLQFSPSTFEIPVGRGVQWEWESGGHNVRADTVPDGSNWSGTADGDRTTYGEGHTHFHTFDTPGEYTYYCAPHRSVGMTGSFTVSEQ